MTTTPRTLHKYRVFCISENVYKYVWSESQPTTCPTNNGHTIDSIGTVIVDTIQDSSTYVTNMPLTASSDLQTSSKNIIYQSLGVHGISELRDIQTSNGYGSVTYTNGDSEIRLVTTSNGSDFITLQTSERFYAPPPGTQSEFSIGIRIPYTPSGSQYVKLGIYDSINGAYFKYTENGLYACVLRDGSEISCVHMNDWNIDSFNGTGLSGCTLDMTNNLIFTILIYDKIIQYRISSVNSEYISKSYIGHIYKPANSSQTLFKNSILPISITLDNNTNTSSRQIFISQRCCGIVGKYIPQIRYNSTYHTNHSLSQSNSIIPCISLQRKTGFLQYIIRGITIDVLSTVDCIFKVKMNTALQNAQFTTPIDINANETALQYDISATSISNGIQIYTKLIKADVMTTIDIHHIIPEYQIVSTLLETLQNTGKVDIVLRWKEEW